MDFKFDLQRFADTITTNQLKFGADNNSYGLFALSYKLGTDGSVTLNGSVQEQSAPVTITAPTSGYSYYLPVTATTDGAVEICDIVAYGPKHSVAVDLEADPVVYQDTYVYADAAEAAMDAIDAAVAAGTFTGGITFNAPTGVPIALDLTEVSVPFTVKNVAKDSLLGLKEGDTATTASLKADDTITILSGGRQLPCVAAAAGAMTFVGETSTDNTDQDNPVVVNSTALYTGTVALQYDSDSVPDIVLLSGATNSAADGIIVETDDADGIVVKAASGKLSSVTGLNGADAVVTVTETTVSNSVTTEVETTYTAMNEAGTMIARTVKTTVGTADPVTVTTYANLSKSGLDLAKATYKEATVTEIGGYGSSSDTGAHTAFYFVGTAATTNAAAVSADNSGRSSATQTAAALVAAGKFVATAGAYYLKVTSSTKNATASATVAATTTTVSAVELWQANAEGTLSKVSTPAFTGAVPSIDAGGAAIVYSKPKTAGFTVTVTDADIRSKFTNLTSADSVTTKAGTYTNLSGSYTVYNGTVSNTVTIKGKANVTVAGGAVESITGLDNGETITLTTTTATGTSTRVITAASGKVTVTDTTEAGVKTIYKNVSVTNLATQNIKSGGDIDDTLAAVEAANKTISMENNFTWTASGSSDGYFLISGSGTSAKAAVKAGKTTISAADAKAGKYYVHVNIANGDNGTGVVTLGAVAASATVDEDGNVTAINVTEETTFKGTITLTAPSDRVISLAARGIDDAATLNITGLAAGSTIEHVLKSQDTVTTAKLAKSTDEAPVTVKINGVTYTSGAANNAITIKDDKLVSGTIVVAAEAQVEVGDFTITNGATSTITVAGTGGGKAFTLDALDDLDKVTVTKGTSSTVYTKYGSYLYDTGNNKMYSLGKKTSIGSAALTGTSGWTAYAASTGATTVNLSAADTRIAADAKTDEGAADTYDFAVNNLAASTKTTAARTAEVVTDGAAAVEGAATFITKVGDVTTATKAYVAADDESQTINAANGWTVTAANKTGDTAVTTTINGAASGSDTMIGAAGDDTFNLKGAADSVRIAAFAGKDTVSGYASKDTIALAADAVYTLSTSKSGDVYAAAAAWTADTENYVLLSGVGVNKAVTINEVDHYFGDGAKATTGTTFTYADGAYYHGNTSGKNILKVGTLKDKASRTNMVDNAITINLGADNTPYENITTVDASGSANALVLTAGAADDDGVGSTLKGGTYTTLFTGGDGDDTFVGGSGSDTFDISGTEGDDVIQDYNKSGTDVLLVGDEALTAASVAVSDSDVVISAGEADGTVTLKNAAGKAITASYGDGATQTIYVGKAGADNTFSLTSVPGAADVYVGSTGTDTLKLTESITALTVNSGEAVDGVPSYLIPLYQGGEIDMSAADQYSSIDAVDASGVKATAATLSEYGNMFVKAHAGVKVNASASGTSFRGSAYNDLFTAGAGADTVEYYVNNGNDTIDAFGATDVIKLYNLSAADIANLEAANTAGTLKDQLAAGFSFNAGGSLTLTNAADGTYTYNKDSKTITVMTAG